MSQYLSLGDMTDRLRYRFDLESLTNRHPDADLHAELNRSWRKLRVRLANIGAMPVLTGTTAAALPTTAAASGELYAEVDWPTDAVSIHGLDVKSSGYWFPLEQVDFTARRRYAGGRRSGITWGEPAVAAWCVRSLPTTATTVASVGKIMVFPVPTSGEYRLWYLPQWVDIATGTPTYIFPGQESWHEWAIYDAGITALRRDNDAAGTLADARAEQQVIWNAINRNAMRLADDGPIEPMGRRRSYRGPRAAP